MTRLLLIVFIFLLIIFSLVFNLFNANKKINNYFELDNQIINIANINTKLKQFSHNNIDFQNYDDIQSNIFDIQNIFLNILNNENFTIDKNSDFYQKIVFIKALIDKEIEIIEKLKSYNAIFNNSIRNIQILKSKIPHNKFDKFYNLALTLNYQKNIDVVDFKIELSSLEYTDKTEQLFLSHTNIIFDYFIKKEALKDEIEKLNLFNEINSLHTSFEIYMQDIIENIKNSIIIFIILLILSIILFVHYAYTVLKNKIELDKFKNTLDISDNIIVITDKNHKIKYVNHGFEKSTGYCLKEVLGKTPSILNAGILTQEFYDKLNETIHKGEKWTGEFINKNKFGKIIYEKSSITPIKDKNGNIIEFLAVKLDITKEKEYQNVLTQQSKMVSMGELLENISHQWRQPLSIISSLSSNMLIQLRYAQPSKDEINSSFEKVFETTQKLSHTIDDLKNFFDKEEEIIIFGIATTIEKAINLFNIKLDDIKVLFKNDIDDCVFKGKESEFIQVILNILNNSFDAFKINNIENKFIEISTKVEENILKITITDNAGGINPEILDKVFELYFTTKHKAIGTGIGLYMVYQIVTNHLKGKVYAKNIEVIKEDINYKGTSIIIEIPMD